MIARLRWRLLWAGIAGQPGRALLAVAAIALGTALGLAVQLINQSAVAEFGTALRMLTGDADFSIRGPRAGFDEALYARVAKLPEVAEASPVVEIETRAVARGAERAEPLRVLGIDVFRASRVQPQLAWSEEAEPLDFLRQDRILLSPAAAESLGVAKGDTIDLETARGMTRFIVAGRLPPGEARQSLGVIDIAAAQDVFGRAGRLSRIDLRLRPGIDPSAFAAGRDAWLPPGLTLERPREAAERAANLSRAYRVNLNVLALVALFTGGLLVFTLQGLSVARRRAQFALLRVLGETRAEVMRRVLIESLALGVAGAVAGLVLGVSGAALVLERLGADLGAGQFRGLQPALQVAGWEIALFFLLGVAASVLGALAAAREAAHAPPARALRAGSEREAFARLAHPLPGLAALAAGGLLTLAPPLEDLPIAGYTAIALILIGTLLLLPRVACAVYRRMARLPVRAAPARLALAQLAGSPAQVAVSLAAVVASVSLAVSMAIMIGSFRVSLDRWLDQVLPADLYLRAPPGGDPLLLDAAAQARLASLPGVARAEFLRADRMNLEPSRPPVSLIAREIDRADPGRRLPLRGDALAVAAEAPPPVWVSEAMVDLYGHRPGAVIELPVGESRARFTVAGVWRDYARQHGAVVIELAVYRRITGDAMAGEAAFWLRPGGDANALRDALRALPGGERLELADPGEIRAGSLRIFDRTFAVTYGLEAVAVALGLAGLSASFAALVLARRREFGVLRHLGFTRAQVGAMLAAEGALVSALGLAVGGALGGLISLILVHVVNRQSFHWSMELHPPWGALAVFAATLFALALAAAVASGRQAMGGAVVRAVKEDW